MNFSDILSRFYSEKDAAFASSSWSNGRSRDARLDNLEETLQAILLELRKKHE